MNKSVTRCCIHLKRAKNQRRYDAIGECKNIVEPSNDNILNEEQMFTGMN